MSNHPHLRPAGNGKPAVTPPPVPGLPTAELSPEDEMRLALEMQQRRDQQARGNMEALLVDPAALLAKLPDLYGQAIAGMVAAGVAQALSTGAVRIAGRLCATCLEVRIGWNQRHAADLERAQAQAMAQLGTTDPQDPRIMQMDLSPLLPANLRPGAVPEGVPPMFDAVTTVGGTEVCPAHHPAAAGKGRGGLILMPGVGAHAAARLALAGIPGN